MESFEEPTPPFVAGLSARSVEPDRAPESILTDLPRSAHSRTKSLQPVDLGSLRPSTAAVGAAEVGVVGHPSAPRARSSGWSRALYAGYAVCGFLLVAGGVRFGLARARSPRLANAPAAIAGPSMLSTRGEASVPSAPPKSASSPVESSSGAAGGETPGGSNAADPPAPAAPAPAPAGPATNTGTLVLSHRTRPGNVWLDGVKITDASTSVACGNHEIRVKGWRKHQIRVPCGGEVRVTH